MWQGITWSHDLRVYEPREIVHPDAMLLFITGGDTNRKASDDDHKQAFGLAQVCGARVAVLPQVPNQPLLDGKTEDELIAETFVRYLQTKDENWPLLFPMVKSAVKAMDAIQAWSKQNGKPVARFVVTGGSKRGWTTWLTGAVDDRVIAIAPMVIVMLNLGPQGPNQLKVWGQYSEQIHDYVERGLMETVATPTGTKLWKMVDPFTYRERLIKPKLLINGANDRYWTLDALDLYWNELQGPEVLDRAAKRRPRSESQPRLGDLGPGGVLPSRRAQSADAAAHVGFCRGSRRRFPRHDPLEPGAAGGADLDGPLRQPRLPRVEVGVGSPLKPGETISYHGQAPSSGRLALFGEVEYQVNGIPFHLTTTFLRAGSGEEVAASFEAGRFRCRAEPTCLAGGFRGSRRGSVLANLPTRRRSSRSFIPSTSRSQTRTPPMSKLCSRLDGQAIDRDHDGGLVARVLSRRGLREDESRTFRRKRLTGRCSKVEHPEKNRWRIETGGKSSSRRRVPAHLPAGVGDDRLCRRGTRRFQRRGDFHHAGGASPTAARSSLRAAGSVEADDDRARAGRRRRAQPLPGR